MSNPVIDKLLEKTKRTDIPTFRPGDTVRVQVKIKEGDKERLQAFEGVVISKRKQTAVERRQGRDLLRANGFLTTEGAGACIFNTANPCGRCTRVRGNFPGSNERQSLLW